ncbi:MAG: hypothetical protein L0Y67_06845 [Gammaproteobacteria bacterium]|nr:hypothetical protein [Gammaproteobacteria bacterium]
MTDDTGFAPNPFHGCCTCATCTPNHMHGRPRLKEGDYIVGIEGVKLRKKRQKKRRQNQSASGDCIIYFMKIDVVLTLNCYFNDLRFAKKQCNPNSSSYIERVGDNVYWQSDGHWRWIPDHPHDDEKNIKKDTDGNRVFISSCFSYFGDMGIPLPEVLREHVPPGKGTKYARHATTGLVKELEGLGSRCGKGLVGHPIDAPPDLILDLSGTPAGCK